ncbi:MAG TPA: MFS transporter [Caulobacteraceae bacterium]|nr:MFS transporter [Caulobacteraceae bacterium]
MTSFLARVYAFNFFDRFILIFPLYTVMFVDAGMKPVEITVCLTAWSVTSFVLQVPSGVVADRWSRRHILAWSQLARGVGFTVWLVYPHFWGFLVGLLLWGIKSAFTSGTFEALLFDEMKARGKAQDYTLIFGRTRAVQSGGVLLAALGAAVVARFGYAPTLVASLVSVAVAFVAAVSLPLAPRTFAREQAFLAQLRLGLSESFHAPPVMSILAFSAIVLALGAALEEFWPIFGAKVGLTRPVIAVFVGAQNGVEMLVSLIAYRLSGLPTRGFYALFAIGGLLLAVAAGLFTPCAMLLLAVYSGLVKLVGVVFEGRLQHAIASERRATIGSVKSFLAQIGITVLYMSFGPVAQATSYRIAFMVCGLAGLAIGLTYLALPGLRRAYAS